MHIDDVKVSRSIIQNYYEKILDILELDVALVGAGPSNLICGTVLGENGIKTAIMESKVSPGGGMWGGGMLFNEVVVQENAVGIFDKLGINYREKGEGYYTADSIESTSTLISNCVKAGTPIFNGIKVEDVLFRKVEKKKKVGGLVIQWSPVDVLGLHVDPLSLKAEYVVDGTGHDAEICTVVSKKMDAKLDTETGGVIGERSMWAERGEEETVENAGEIYPGLFVTGMAANATRGGPRMGPIFGGMLLSGTKVAEELIRRLKK